MASPQRAVPRERTWSFNSVSGQIRPQPVYNYVNNNKIADKIGRLSTKSGGWLGKQSTLPVPRQTPPAMPPTPLRIHVHVVSTQCSLMDQRRMLRWSGLNIVFTSSVSPYSSNIFNHDIPPSFANQPSPCLPSPATPLPHTSGELRTHLTGLQSAIIHARCCYE